MFLYRFRFKPSSPLPFHKLLFVQVTKMSTTSTPQAKIRQWASKDGEFRRQVSSFRDSVSRDPNAQFAAEPCVYTNAIPTA